MDSLARLAQALHANRVRFVVIGVWGVNYYARSGGTLFTTQDQDLFLPLDPENLLRAWQSCDCVGLWLWAADESRFVQGVTIGARSGPPDSLRRGRTRASVRPEAATERSKQLERLDSPRDLQLAGAVVERGAGTTATDDEGLQIDLALVMAGFDFERVWSSRRTFLVDDVDIPVARLTYIVSSKAKAGREKDRLFLATHAEALRQLMRHEEDIDEC